MSGGKLGLLTAGLALGACAQDPARLTVRPASDGAAMLARGGDELAVARGQLALNNVGLALEGFRRVNLQRPADPAPLAGIADCYMAMNRFDLAQPNYEAALALAPRDPKLLLALARLFELEGQADRSAAVRGEAQAASAAARSLSAAQPPAPAQIATALPTAAQQMLEPHSSPGSVTVKLPAARPAPIAPTVAAAVAAQRAVPQAAAITVLVAAPKGAALPPSAVIAPTASLPQSVAAAPTAPLSPTVTVVRRAPLAASGTVAIPSARLQPAAAVPTPALVALSQPVRPSSSVTVALPPARPADAARDLRAAPVPMLAIAPRLQRLSRGEVALVTRAKSLWTAPSGVQLAAAKAVQWIALKRWPTGIQVVNAARTSGLAASARAVLLQRGWRGIRIATSPAYHGRSVVLYPRGREELARRLAGQFAIRTRAVHEGALVLVLGRDKVGSVRPQRQL